MRRVITFIAVALFALCVMPVSAQGDFDFDNASNFHLLWLDEGMEKYWEITPRIEQDLRLNGEYGAGGVNQGERFFDVWTSTFIVNPVSDKGALGQIGGYMSTTAVNPDWAGGGFQLIPQVGSPLKVDFTNITDDYRFHMAIKKAYPAACRINLYGGGKSDGTADDNSCAQFAVGVGGQVYADPILPNLTPNFVANQWQVIDIPVSQLREMGWKNRAAFTGYYFSFEHGGGAAQRPNDLAMDAIFYYKAGPASDRQVAIDNKLKVLVTNQIVEVLNATAPIEVYNLTGVNVLTTKESVFGVDELNKGVYFIKSGSAVAKVLIK